MADSTDTEYYLYDREDRIADYDSNITISKELARQVAKGEKEMDAAIEEQKGE